MLWIGLDWFGLGSVGVGLVVFFGKIRGFELLMAFYSRF